MIDIFIDNRQEDLEITENEVELVSKLFEFAVNYLDEKDRVEVSLSFVGDEEIRALNAEYRGIDKITDVLSFPLFSSFDGVKQLGDVVINTGQLKKQAEEFGHSYRRELTYLSLHSLLHLYGFDHEGEEDKKVMRKLEEDILLAFEGE